MLTSPSSGGLHERLLGVFCWSSCHSLFELARDIKQKKKKKTGRKRRVHTMSVGQLTEVESLLVGDLTNH